MKLCSLALSRRLKELGVKQESLFSWGISRGLPWSNEPKGVWRLLSDGPSENQPNSSELCSAFTVAELGEMLPEKAGGGFYRQKLFDGGPNRAEIYYADVTSEVMVFPKDSAIVGVTEADARALMLIYLIEQGLVKV